MAQKTLTKRECMQFRKVDSRLRSKEARQKGITYPIQCDGSHVKADCPGYPPLTMPAHDTGPGLATKIWKWLLRVGLISGVIIALWLIESGRFALS